MILVQQIKAIVIVDLEVAHIYLVLVGRVLLYFVEDVRQSSRD